MTYDEIGFNKLLYKTDLSSSNGELSEDQSNAAVTSLSGSVISGGTTQSTSGKVTFDWDNGTLIFSDGAFPRILIGYQEGGFNTE